MKQEKKYDHVINKERNVLFPRVDDDANACTNQQTKTDIHILSLQQTIRIPIESWTICANVKRCCMWQLAGVYLVISVFLSSTLSLIRFHLYLCVRSFFSSLSSLFPESDFETETAFFFRRSKWLSHFCHTLEYSKTHSFGTAVVYCNELLFSILDIISFNSTENNVTTLLSY